MWLVEMPNRKHSGLVSANPEPHTHTRTHARTHARTHTEGLQKPEIIETRNNPHLYIAKRKVQWGFPKRLFVEVNSPLVNKSLHLTLVDVVMAFVGFA